MKNLLEAMKKHMTPEQRELLEAFQKDVEEQDAEFDRQVKEGQERYAERVAELERRHRARVDELNKAWRWEK